MEVTEEQEQLRVDKVWERVFGREFTVKSMNYERQKKGITYTVVQIGNEWKCSCPSFKFKAGLYAVYDSENKVTIGFTCKHIRKCLKEIGVKYRYLF